MTGSRVKLEKREHLSRRGFLKLSSASFAALAWTAYTRRPVSSTTTPVFTSPRPAFINHVFLPVVTKVCSNPLPSPRPMEILFEDDFSLGTLKNTPEQHWDKNGKIVQHGTIVDFVSDPTNPCRKVMRIMIAGDPENNLPG
jgi:hypothetical protein